MMEAREKYGLTENFFKIIGLIVDVGTEILRDVLYTEIPPENLATVLNDPNTLKIIRQLHYQRRPAINVFQFDILTKADPDAKEFDISLLVLVLRNICKNIEAPNPPEGWNIKPGDIDDNDTSLGAEILRLKNVRNSVTAHTPSTHMSNEEFDKTWGEISGIILRIATKLNKTEEELESIKQQIAKAYSINIDVSGAKEQRWLEAFRQGQLQELEEFEQDIAEIQAALNDKSSQLQEAISPMMEKLVIRFKRTIISVPSEVMESQSGGPIDVSSEVIESQSGGPIDVSTLRKTVEGWNKNLEHRKKKLKYYGYDAYIFYARTDGEACRDAVRSLKELSQVPELKIALYEDLPLTNLTMTGRMDYILENCRYLLFYITSSFKEDTMKMFETDMCLKSVIEEKSYRAFPLWTKPKGELCNIPKALDCLNGLQLWMVNKSPNQHQAVAAKFDKAIIQGRKEIP